MPGMTTRSVGRRSILKWMSIAAAAPIVAACSAAAQPTAAPAPTKPAEKPAEATKPAASAAAPTTVAPAATKPAAQGATVAATKPATQAATAAATKPAVAAAQAPATGSSNVTLKALYWSDSPESHQVHLNVFKAFSEKNGGVKVEFDDTPSDAFVQKVTTMMAGGTPPDVMKLHPSWVLRFITAKQLTDLTDLSKDDRAAYLKAQLEFWTYQDRIFGMPYYSGPSFVYYNKSIFQKYGVKTPDDHLKAGTWTWQTLKDLAKQVSQGTGADRTFGWDAAQDATNIQYYTCVPVWDSGGELINKDETAWQVDSPEVIEVYQWHADMYLKDKSIPLPSDLQGISWLFDTGKLGMAWAGKFRALNLINAKFEIGMIGTPKGKVGPINRDGPNATGIPLGTKVLPQAYALAKFWGGPQAAPEWLGSGASIPVQTALLDSPEFKKGLKPFEDPKVYAESASTVRAWRIPGKGPEELRALKAEWEKVLVGQQDVPTAMKAAKAAMDPLLK